MEEGWCHSNQKYDREEPGQERELGAQAERGSAAQHTLAAGEVEAAAAGTRLNTARRLAGNEDVPLPNAPTAFPTKSSNNPDMKRRKKTISE